MPLIQATMALGSPHPRSVLTLANGWWPAPWPLLDSTLHSGSRQRCVLSQSEPTGAAWPALSLSGRYLGASFPYHLRVG